MKWAIFPIFVGVVAASCSITHRSNDYACTTQDQCEAGRVCYDGYCVVPTGTMPDAPKQPPGKDAGDPPMPDAPDPVECPEGCSDCNPGNKECRIVCGEPGAARCDAKITCPTGWSCNVECNRDFDCRLGIDCNGATECNIQCNGAGSCQGVQCGPGPCEVQCDGSYSCGREMRCRSSCECDIICTGANSCGGQFGPNCGTYACDALDGGCTSMPAQVCAATCP